MIKRKTFTFGGSTVNWILLLGCHSQVCCGSWKGYGMDLGGCFGHCVGAESLCTFFVLFLIAYLWFQPQCPHSGSSDLPAGSWSCFPGNWLREVWTGGGRDFCPWEQFLTNDDRKLLEKCFFLLSLGGDVSERYLFSFQRAWQDQILYGNAALYYLPSFSSPPSHTLISTSWYLTPDKPPVPGFKSLS